jgi:mannose-1-phosphate guanylyltransferase/mannose-6-phosphate isomerase
MKIIPIILSGGSGKRLWPISRKNYPKQYITLIGDKSSFQETILRLNGLDNILSPIVVCNSDHRFVVAEQLNQIGISESTILLEPIGRNTAPAIVAAALHAQKIEENAILLVLSADHLINNIEAFHRAIMIAVNNALKEKLVTFGIIPTDSKTDYGYIKLSDNEYQGAYKVNKFIEKPDEKVAKTMLEEGGYLWNSGMFVFKPGVLIDEMKVHSTEIVTNVNKALNSSKVDLDFIRLGVKDFESCESNSIDYALMEKSSNVVVVPLDAEWSDIGTWSSLDEASRSDKNGNVIKGEVIIKDTMNSYIDARNHMFVAIGLKNIVVVDTPDVTLIASKEKANEVKLIAEKLHIEGRTEVIDHRKVYRPWGWYDSIEVGKHFQVKRLHVNPRAKLSLQLHHQRAEHWVVISGMAKVINGSETFILIEGQSTFIPLGTKHSLSNETDNNLEIIEIQSGLYLGEDDIIRFDDIYGRLDRKY